MPSSGDIVELNSAAQCQHVLAVSTGRILATHGNTGPVILGQIRETLALLLECRA